MPRETIGEGRFLRLVRENKWEFAERTRSSGVVVIVPFTDDGQLLFVEQFRPPVNSLCIEFPAGLAGDTDDANETLATAAHRELLEETGFDAADLEFLACVSPTAGLTSEMMSYFVARGLRRVGVGGGVEHEQITTHLVPRANVRNWLAEQSQRAIVSATVYCGLYLTAQT